MESVPEMREPLRVTTAPSSLKRSGHPSTPVLDDEQVQGQSKRVRLDTDLHDSRDAAALSDDDNRWRPATSEQQPHASTSSPSRSDTSPSSSPRLPKDVCCCKHWRICEAAGGRCRYGARHLMRIHDEDSASVDLVQTDQFGPGQTVVYKQYDASEEPSLELSAAAELALYPVMAGRHHTIELLDSFEDRRGNTVFVFPYISGDHTPQTPRAIQSYARQLLEALAFIHDEVGVMHRNIKRQNCMFDAEGRLTLIDFESAVQPVEGAWYPRVGNEWYRAPEVALREEDENTLPPVFLWNAPDARLSRAAQYGFPGDVFAAGVSLAELLLGVRHFFRSGEMGPQYDLLRERMRERGSGEADSRWVFNPWVPRWRRFARPGCAEGSVGESGTDADTDTAAAAEERQQRCWSSPSHSSPSSSPSHSSEEEGEEGGGRRREPPPPPPRRRQQRGRGADDAERRRHTVDLGTGAFTPLAADLLCGLLEADPRRRLTAAQALRHAYFAEEAPQGEGRR